MRLALCLVLFAFSLAASSGEISLKKFKKRFVLEKNTRGEVVAIHDRSLGMKNFEVQPALDRIVEDAEYHRQKVMALGSKAYAEEIDSLDRLVYEEMKRAVNDPNTDEALRKELRSELGTMSSNDYIAQGFINLPNLNFKELFSRENMKKVWVELKKQVRLYVKQQRIATVARLDNPRYYYTQRGVNNIVKTTLKYAKKIFKNKPFLGVAIYVIKRVDGLIHERRLYHQNMLRYYLERFTPSELGLTKSEADRAMSSIYEAQISLGMVWESNNAVRNWQIYGFNKHYQEVRSCKKRSRKISSGFERMGRNLGHAFQRAYSFKGSRLIMNLLNKKHRFSRKASVAYNFDHPYRIALFRMFLGLSKVGVNLLPVGERIRGFIESFIDSIYMPQKINEGMLMGYLESHSYDEKMIRTIQLQTVNPYDLYWPMPSK
jgi:hypothetical protein